VHGKESYNVTKQLQGIDTVFKNSLESDMNVSAHLAAHGGGKITSKPLRCLFAQNGNQPETHKNNKRGDRGGTFLLNRFLEKAELSPDET